MAQAAYISTEPARIGATLARMFADLQEEGSTYNQSANSNLLVPVADASHLQELEPILDSLALVHPARVFILVLDQSKPKLEAQVSARCYGLSKDEHVCSEIIRVSGSTDALSAAPSVLRANLLTGTTTEMLVLGSQLQIGEISRFASLADSILIDSASLSARFSDLSEISAYTKNIIDFTWVGLGIWRDELKSMIARSGALPVLSNLERVHILATGIDGRVSASALLFAGWIADRLHLNLRCDESGMLRGRGPQHPSVEFVFEISKADQRDALDRVAISFRGLTGTIEAELCRGALLEARSNFKQAYKASRRFEDETLAGRMRRQFLIGESFANYPGALVEALKLFAISPKTAV
jgi:hypothetical protein